MKPLIQLWCYLFIPLTMLATGLVGLARHVAKEKRGFRFHASLWVVVAAFFLGLGYFGFLCSVGEQWKQQTPLAKAAADAARMRLCLALYRKEYGCLPVPAGRSTFEYGPSNYVDLLSVLYGKNSQLNRRNVVILEPTLGTNEFRDPWGMPYFVRLTQTRNASDVGKVEIWSEGSGDSILLEEDRTVISRDIKKD